MNLAALVAGGRQECRRHCGLFNPGSVENQATTMPDSPADVKTQSRSSPPNMPPPSPAVSQGATRHPTFTSNPSSGMARSLDLGMQFLTFVRENAFKGGIRSANAKETVPRPTPWEALASADASRLVLLREPQSKTGFAKREEQQVCPCAPPPLELNGQPIKGQSGAAS
ncbi:hypothetical protein Chor_004881 [Crotalus horridus]